MLYEYTTKDKRTGGAWYLAVDSKPRLLSQQQYRYIKRALDILLCLMVIPLALPVMAVIAALVAISSPGPILFRQLRTGKGGRRFWMYKFRSMVSNAEELKQRYLHLNQHSGPDFKIEHDPRVTTIGRVLRKSSLDELPQLWNVLRGDMTLVGPRPTSFGSEAYSLWHTHRLDVVPGITGLWQISGRSDLDFDQRLKLDIAYIEHQCLWLDLQILLWTVAVVFTGKGAY